MKVIAFAGMPGAGKSVASGVARGLGITVLRLGDLTDEELKKQGLGRNEANERRVREGLRKEHGMDVYAKRVTEKADKHANERVVVLDGVRSYDEYKFLKGKYEDSFVLASILAAPKTRHQRLGVRKVRSLTEDECVSRDEAELRNLDHGSTIAMGGYYIVNEKLTLEEFKEDVEVFLMSFD